MIGIIDYGMGNLRSVERALEAGGAVHRRVLQPADFAQTHGLVLPGVGAFGQAVANLKSQDLWDPLLTEIRQGKPLLGLCLGLQLLFETSEEFGAHQGLGILRGQVHRMPPGTAVPHIGWNQVFPCREDPLFEGIPEGSHFYFLHSYIAEATDESDVVAICRYGTVSFPAVVQRGMIRAAQFHPEKSQQVGLRFLANFVRYVRERND